ncbi:predicted protein [Naegleria gruberi]|uniref:Predicted protein n=1 Tax=Naegleria gruberi TaxID=5762 RepID=D2VX65_NAEGR|nr:uncharacterized protein NAEGRDRAFT_81564 [Naegleria gruberi]EFC38623.1 predicted protein [Naegleria gruberi]|eukprot:XP_002671367.1 predicted protein [Naegleria gruberi strain NEG-M]
MSSSSDNHASSSGEDNSSSSSSLIRSNILEYLTDPQLTNNIELQNKLKKTKPQTWLVLVLHFLMLKHGFRCVGLNETDQCVELPEGQILPPNNFDSNVEMFSLKYKHTQRTFNFTLKVLMMGQTKLLVFSTILLFPNIDINENSNLNMSQYAKQQEEEQVYQLEFNNLFEFIDREKFNEVINQSNDNIDFISVFKNLQDLEYQFKTQIQNKLVPKEGFETISMSSTQSSNNATTTNVSSSLLEDRQPRQYIPPSRSMYDEDDDDFDPLRIGPPRRGGYIQPPIGGRPYRIGDEDLYPGLGHLPQPFGGRGSGFPFGGGSQVGPNNPLFFPGSNNNRRPNPGFIPGARFDPIYPNAPFGGQGRGGGQPNPDHHRVPRDLDDDDEDFSHFYM